MGLLIDDLHPSGESSLSMEQRLDALCEEGRDFWYDFDTDIRQDSWHPFVAADYDLVREALLALRRPGRRFLEWGSASGVVTIMADLMGFDACGIEIDASLVGVARDLAKRTDSKARFVTGSFIPTGWQWKPPDGDGRSATIGQGRSGYLELGCALEDFDIVYGYPWSGEEALMRDLMRAHGGGEAILILHCVERGVRVYQRGVEVDVSELGGP